MAFKFNPFTGKLDEFGPVLSNTGSVAAADDGDATTPGISFANDLNTGIYRPGADQIGFSTGGTGRLFVDASGRVGIGVTPTTTLQVKGGFRLEDQATSPSIVIRDTDAAGDASITQRNSGDFTLINSATGRNVIVENDGSERLRITSDGKLGLGTSSPGSVTSGGANLTLASNNPSITEGVGIGSLSFKTVDGSFTGTFADGIGAEIASTGFGTVGASYNLAFITSTTTNSSRGTRMLIDGAGRVGIGTSSPSSKLEVNGTITIGTGTGTYQAGVIGYTDANWGCLNRPPRTGSIAAYGFQSFDGDTRMVITDAGNVGIGTSSPINPLEVNYSSATQTALRLLNTDTTATAICGLEFDVSNGASGGLLYIDSSVGGGNLYNIHLKRGQSSSAICFDSPSTEHARIDSSGRLLVGTTTVPSGNIGGFGNQYIQVLNQSAIAGIAVLSTDNSIFGSQLFLGKSRGGTTTIVQSGDILGQVVFAGADGQDIATAGAVITARVDGTPGADDLPCRLTFSTTADGASSPTERMRIGSNGQTYWGAAAPSGASFGTSIARLGIPGLLENFRNTDGAGGVATIGGTVGYAIIRGDGDLENTNNSYTGISDIKLKENIVDANSQWDDLKALQVRNYNFKAETGFNTHTQIGLVAQEVELVSPGLVSESPDRDAEGNDLGTVTKSVNYSVLYMKAVKALQEAMERIETLEAKVNVLEGN